MNQIIMISEEELKQAKTLTEFLRKANDNSHILLDKAIILESCVLDIHEDKEINRELIKNMAEQINELSRLIRSDTTRVLKFLQDK